MSDKENRVEVYHPEQKATARPLKEHLEAWLAAGWQQVNATPIKEGNKK